MAWHYIIDVSSRILLPLWFPLPSYYKRHKLLDGQQSANKFGKNQTMLHGCTDLGFTSLGP
jgi:hypothetical protein